MIVISHNEVKCSASTCPCGRVTLAEIMQRLRLRLSVVQVCVCLAYVSLAPFKSHDEVECSVGCVCPHLVLA